MLTQNIKLITIITIIGLLCIPVAASAAVNDLQDIIDILIGIIKQATILVVALALLAFFIGLARFIYHADNEEKRKDGKNIMIWGIIALFVMLSLAGILRVLDNTFFSGSGGGQITPPAPTKSPPHIII